MLIFFLTFLPLVFVFLPYILRHFLIPFLIFLIYIVVGGIQGPLDTAATNGLFCQPRVIMMMEKSVE
jgi:hypothetical protein